VSYMWRRRGSVATKFNTSNLLKHLKTHSVQFKDLLEEKKKQEQSKKKHKGASSNQDTLKSMIERRSPYSANHPRTKAITFRVAEMIAADLQPFSVVSDVEFECLLAKMEPRYVLPSHQHFSKVLIPETFIKVKHRISGLLDFASYVALTTDIWTSANGCHLFLSLTAHFIVEESIETKDIMLCAWQFDESHNGGNISAAILSHVHQWENSMCFAR